MKLANLVTIAAAVGCLIALAIPVGQTLGPDGPFVQFWLIMYLAGMGTSRAVNDIVDTVRGD